MVVELSMLLASLRFFAIFSGAEDGCAVRDGSTMVLGNATVLLLLPL